MSFPDFNPSFNFQPNIDELALDLALSVLHMSKTDFQSMSSDDLKKYYTNFGYTEQLAFQVLLSYKNKLPRVNFRNEYHFEGRRLLDE